MNRSSIVFAFLLAGFICVVVHDLLIGPIAYGPNNILYQSAKKQPAVVDLAPIEINTLGLER